MILNKFTSCFKTPGDWFQIQILTESVMNHFETSLTRKIKYERLINQAFILSPKIH